MRLSAISAVATACLVIVMGCDPNEPDAFAIRFNNDLKQSVVLALCHSDHSAKCEHPYYRDTIAPGKATEENISPDVRTEWAIEDTSGTPLRCVVLYWKDWPGHDEQIRVSAAPIWAWPCPRTTPARPI
jgi:hypothetical protein